MVVWSKSFLHTMQLEAVYKAKRHSVTVDLKKDTINVLRRKVGALFNLHWSSVELRDTDPTIKEDKKSATKVAVKKFTGETLSLEKVGLSEGVKVVYVKNLGAQFSYRGVFLIEYGGPIAIALLFALRPSFLFGAGSQPLDVVAGLKAYEAAEGTADWNRFVQCLAFTAWVAHFVKRELETLFVHKFSNPYMPLFNLFKNSTYYWSFAAMVGFPLVHPAYQAPGKVQVAVGAGLWVASQLTNLAVHLQLAGMRGGEGDNDRRPPQGPLFALVTSPNYTAEVLGWLGWSVMSSIAMGYLFTLGGFVQMAQWSMDKYRKYKNGGEEGKAYVKGRKSIIPFLL